MKVIATNIGKATSFLHNGKKELTGIYKYPSSNPIFLGKTDVSNDSVIDRKHHGGVHKACYLFSSEHYPYWKNIYPKLDWDWGMFGENLTIQGLDESQICIGDIFAIGNAVVQVSLPREPCYKLGVRFGDPKIIKQFIDYGFPGTYVRILEEGWVTKGDPLVLKEMSANKLSIRKCFKVILSKEKDPISLQKAIGNQALPEYKRERLKKYALSKK